MTNIYHNPIPSNAPLNSVTFNVALGELDQAIADLVSGELNWIVRGSSPGTPGTGFAKLYFKSDGLYFLTSTGVEQSASAAKVRLIAYTQLSVSTPTITLSNLSQNYKHLTLKLSLRTDYAGAVDDLYLQFNGDATASNYSSLTDDSVNNVHKDWTEPGIKIWAGAAGAGADANIFGILDPLDIYRYTDATRHKGVNFRGVVLPTPAVASSFRAPTGGGIWINTSEAITEIALLPVNGSNFVAGSSYEVLATT